MGQFIVSARKYRPGSFESLVGQENIATTLKNSILRNQLAHAYLFCGPRGVGKTSAARIFAKTINCSNPSADMTPCGECESCRSFAEGRSYNIHELDAASNNSVDDIRALTDKVRIPPQIGRYSVYIIDEVHMLSQAAFNAFLKTLEEPPAYAIFILATTEKHKILPTILSRCQTYDFNRISIPDIVRNLKDIASKEGITISEDALHIIARKADGAMRDALTLFDQTVAFCGTEITYAQVIKNLNVLDYEYYFNLTEAFLKGDYATALLIFDDILSHGFNAFHFITGLSTHFRNLIVSMNGATGTLLDLAPTIAEKYKATSLKCPPEFLFQALEYTTACEAQYRQSGNQRLLIEFALMKISRIRTAAAVQPVNAAPDGPAKPAQTPASQAPAAVNPAAAPAPMPAAAPAKHTGFSISAALSKAQEKAPDAKSEEFRELTEDGVREAWGKLAESEAKMPRLSSAISQSEPVVNMEEKIITFNVASAAQKEWIDRNCRLRMEAFLRKTLCNNTVRLAVEVIESGVADAPKKPYMQSEKAGYLLRTSPEFRELKKDFELEVK